MPKFEGRPTIELRVSLSLSEQEAGALDALLGYDVEDFITTFYEKMGKSYLQPYEEGLRSLFEARGTLRGLIDRADKARRVFSGEYLAIPRSSVAPKKDD